MSPVQAVGTCNPKPVSLSFNQYEISDDKLLPLILSYSPWPTHLNYVLLRFDKLVYHSLCRNKTGKGEKLLVDHKNMCKCDSMNISICEP